MRIISFQAENFQRLVAVDITPTGDIVTLTGKNANGKSSVLDGLWALFEGASILPSDPVHKGAEKAKLRADLGEFIVTRTISKKADGGYTTSLRVESPKGAVYPSPQKMLSEFIGKLSFDPLAFARSKPREQFDALAKFVPGIDFDEIAGLNRGDFEKRTDVNRRAKEARAAASVIVVPTELPERISEQDLVQKMASATQRENEIAEHGRRKQALDDRIAAVGRKVEDLERRAEALRRELEAITSQVAETTAEAGRLVAEAQAFPPPPERIDVQAVAAELNAARAANMKLDEHLRNVEKKASLERLAKSLEDESEQLTLRIQARNAQKDEAISKAQMPVEGISFGDGEILYNGVSFAQASTAEKIRISVAIAAAFNPKLRVVHIRDGSLLDSESKAWLAEYAAKNDLQVWVEEVSDGDGVGFVIHDGRNKVPETQGEAA